MKIKFLEESILIVSAFWMLIYLYAQYHLSSAAYGHILLVLPFILIFISIISYLRKRQG